MEKIEMHEVHGTKELEALKGCLITGISRANEDEEQGLCLDCKDESGNLVSLVILGDGSMHFCDTKKENLTFTQLGELAMLTECSDIDSVQFNNADPLIEIVIKPIGVNSANRVIDLLRELFPKLQVCESKWNFEGEFHPMFSCCDPTYYLLINVAVLPKNILKGIIGT